MKKCNLRRKLLVIVAVFCLTLALFVTGCGGDEDDDLGILMQLEFILLAPGNTAYSVRGVAGTGNVVVIPAVYNDKPVTHIINYGFYNQPIIRVTIPEGIVQIGSFSFARSLLTSVNIPNSVTTIGSRAFRNDLESVTSILIGEDVITRQSLGVQGSDHSFGNGFDNFYRDNERLAGRYTFSNGSWNFSPR